MIEEIMEYNEAFVQKKDYEKYITSKYPKKKLAILSCMDTRLVELLPAALGIKNGDVKMIKNAGGVMTHPYGSVVRSLLIAIFELGVTEVMVIGHTDCGVQHINVEDMLQKMEERNVSTECIDMLKFSGIDFNTWLGGFESIEESVANTVEQLVKHPLIPKDIIIRGYIMDSTTGKLTEVNSNKK